MNAFPDIRTLVPQAGAMCLLAGIEQADAQSITCRAVSHRDPANPLRHDGRLAVVHAVEYAAQAVAAHGGLRRTPGSAPRGGMIAVLTGIHWTVDRLDGIAADLTVTARQTADGSDSLAYAFTVSADDRLLAAGELMVALQPEAAA